MASFLINLAGRSLHELEPDGDVGKAAVWEGTAAAFVLHNYAVAQATRVNDRRDTNTRLYDWYRGKHADLNDAEYKKHFPRLHSARKDSIRKEKLPIIRYIVEMMCMVCSRPPQFVLTDANGEDAKVTDPAQKAFRKYLDETKLPLVVHTGEKLRYLFGQIFWQIAWHVDRMSFDIRLPQYVDVSESPIDPKHLPWASAIFLANDRPEGSNYTVTYTVWTRDIDTDGKARWGSFQVAEGGAILKNPLFPDGVNGYGFHPVIGWYEEPPIDSVFVEPDQTLEAFQVEANMMWSQFGYTMAYSSFGREHIIGNMANRAELPGSPDAVLSIPGSPQTNKVGSTPALATMADIVTGMVAHHKVHAQAKRLPAGLFDLDTTNIQTGVAIAEGKGDMQDARIQRAVSMYDDVVTLAERGIDVWNYWHNDPEDQIPEGYGVRAVFWSTAMNAAVSQAKAQGDDIRYKHGGGAVWKDNLAEEGINWRTASAETIDRAKSEALEDSEFYRATTTGQPAEERRPQPVQQPGPMPAVPPSEDSK